MPLIEVQRVPGIPKERHNVKSGTMLYKWLQEANIHKDVEILKNKVKIKDEDEIDFPLISGDIITIYDQPKGGMIGTILNPLEHFNPIKFTQKILSFLIKQPDTNVSSSSKTSPNNSLKGQTNIARNGEAKPDNYGQVRAFPDLIQESLFEYDNNVKKVTEWMSFGLGKYDVSSVRYSESNLGSLAGASYRIYQPGELIPLIYEGFAFADIDGQELPGPNESDDFPAETATTLTDMVFGEFVAGQALVRIKKNSDFDYFYDLLIPHSVSFVVNVTYMTTRGEVTKNITVYADLINAETTDDGEPIDPQYFYEFTFSNLGGNDYSNTPADATVNTVIFTLNDNEALIVGPSFAPLPGEQLWVHVQGQLGNNERALCDIVLWMVDDDNNQLPGTSETHSVIVRNNSGKTDTRYETFKITPVAGYGRYAVQFKRTNNSGDTNTLKVEAIHIVRTRNNVAYPYETLVTVTVTATERATSARDRKYNALITRHAISYDIDTMSVDYSIKPSRSFADAVIHTWLVMGGQQENTIDIYELYSIAKSLPDRRLGYFDFTFDDEDISLGSRIQTICDAATVTSYWDDGILSFTRDDKRDSAATVFNRANTKTEDYSLSYEMTLPGGFDGVEIKYRNPTTNKQAFIRYKITGDTIEEGEAIKSKKFDMLYVRNAYQARDRALKEIRRLLYSRQTMSIKAMSDGEWVNVGQMVQVADMYDKNQQDGYIVYRNGDSFETSERIIWDGDMYVVITDSNGVPITSEFPASKREDTEFGFISALPHIQLNIFNGNDVQSPSRYIIATRVEIDATKWTITEKRPNSDDTTSLTLSEYSDEVYNYEVIE